MSHRATGQISTGDPSGKAKEVLDLSARLQAYSPHAVAETMKEAWAWALDSLRSYLETGKPISVEAWEEAREVKGKATRTKPK